MRRFRQAGATEAGFTIVELLIVISMVAVFTSLLTLGVRQASESFRLRRAATLVASELRRAHDAAISQGVTYTVEFVLNPSGLRVYRPAGRPIGGVAVAALSNGIDARVVTVEGYAGGSVETKTLTLDGTAQIVNVTGPLLEGVTRITLNAASADRTVTIRAGSMGPTIATIGPGQTVVGFDCPTGSALTADLSYCVRGFTAEWPNTVKIKSGATSFPACTAPGSGSNRCVGFTPFGTPSPDNTNAVQLCSAAQVPVQVEVVQATGRITIAKAGSCP